MNFTFDSISGTANSNLLVSFTEVNNYLQPQTVKDESLSAFLSDTITLISNKFEEYIEKGILAQNYIGYYNGTGTTKLFTENFPINNIISLQYRDNPTASWTDFYSASLSANIFNNNHFIELYDKCFPCGRKNIKIIYNAGYTSTPAQIKQIALEAIQDHYNNSKRGNNILGLKSKTDSGEDGSTKVFEDLWNKHKEILDQYKIIFI